MTIIVNDTFTDTDGVLLQPGGAGHTPDIGFFWFSFIQSTNVNLAIDTNEIKITATDAQPGVNFSALIAAESRLLPLDSDITLDFRIDAGNADCAVGLASRIFSGGDFVYAFYQNVGGAGNYFIVKVNAGASTQLATAAENLATGEHTMVLESRGSGTNYTLKVDAASKATATDSDNEPVGSHLGIIVSAPAAAGAAWRFDDYVGEDKTTGGFMEADFVWGDK